MANGLPLSATRGRALSDLDSGICDWPMNISIALFAYAARVNVDLGDLERSEPRRCGCEHGMRESRDEIAEQTADIYRWALGRGLRPECVRLD